MKHGDRKPSGRGRDLVRMAKAPARLLIKEPVRWARRRAAARASTAPERLDGPLARDGGLPVRDVRVRPWPQVPHGTAREYWAGLQPVFQHLFRSGREGLPQELSRRFGERWAEHVGARHAMLLPHGTDALRLALAAVLDTDGLEYGGEVIVPNLSFVASSNAALDRRLGVALVDVDPQTLLLDPDAVERAIVPGKTRAIMPVHLFGQTADMARLCAIADRHDLKIVEDAAQAHGAIHELGHAGALGDAAAFSFQSFKNLAAGEGGALTTSDTAVFDRAFELHNVGRPRAGGERWMHESLGWNVRPSEYVAAVLLERLKQQEARQELRARRFEELRAELAGLESIRPLGIGPGVVRHGVHMFVWRYAPEGCGGLMMEDYVAALKAEGVPVQALYNGMTQAQQPVFRRLAEKRSEYLRVLPTPVADRAVREALWMPHELFLGDEADMRELAAAFAKVERHHRPVRVAPGAPAALSGAAATEAASANGSSSRPLNGSTGGPNGGHVLAPAPGPSSGPSSRPDARARRPLLRVGLAGAGAMGRLHAAAVARSPRLCLVGVADLDAEAARRLAHEHGARAFASGDELAQADELDVLIVAVPHWHHAAAALPALERGLHVVCEKPLAVTVSQADQLVRAAERSSGLFTVVLQNRLEPVYAEARRLLAGGELGPLVRASIVESAWRTAGYFASSPWRATWRGEGGGVLVNQAPHVLDRYVWLCGSPAWVLGRCDTNLHAIEVEDTASAILRHAAPDGSAHAGGGAHGHLHVSTAEAPPISRTLLTCDRGRIEVHDGRLLVTTLDRSLREAAADEALSARLDGRTRELSVSRLGTIPAQLDAYYANLVAAIDGTEPLAVPGIEGLASVELANAIALSSARGAAVQLPLDRDAFQSWMDSKLAGSRPRPEATAPQSAGEVARS